MVKWSEASPQAKVFAITHAVVMLVELLGEISLVDLLPEESRTMKVRFWAQYVIGAAWGVIVGVLGYVTTDCMARSGWTKLAWTTPFLSVFLAGPGGFMLHGMDTIMQASTGMGSVPLIRSAYAHSKKKKSKAK